MSLIFPISSEIVEFLPREKTTESTCKKIKKLFMRLLESLGQIFSKEREMPPLLPIVHPDVFEGTYYQVNWIKG